MELFVLPLHLDGLEPFGLPGAGEGETALLRLIWPGLFEDDRVEHDEIAVLALERDDAFSDADHVCGHADAAVFVGDERFQQVLRDGQAFRQGRRGFPGEEKLVFADVTDHKKSPVWMKESHDGCPIVAFSSIGVARLELAASCSQTYREYFFRSFIAVFGAF